MCISSCDWLLGSLHVTRLPCGPRPVWRLGTYECHGSSTGRPGPFIKVRRSDNKMADLEIGSPTVGPACQFKGRDEASAKAGTIANAQNDRDPKKPGTWRAENADPGQTMGWPSLMQPPPLLTGGFGQIGPVWGLAPDREMTPALVGVHRAPGRDRDRGALGGTPHMLFWYHKFARG